VKANPVPESLKTEVYVASCHLESSR